MRNFDHTKEFPNYHVIINFYRQMAIKDFTRIESKAFGCLARWGVRGFFVHEPTVSRNWLHAHMLAIYNRSQDDLRDCIRYAFSAVELTYGKDFDVTVKPMGTTIKDYRRICSYILKFNGGRKTNRFTPVLFIKNLGLRKTGSFGKWFSKTQGELWQEYLDELQRKREQRARWNALMKINSLYSNYKREEPFQYVIAKNLDNRLVNPSQRATLANDVWTLSNANSIVPKVTQDQVAERFKISKTMVQWAGLVRESASALIQQEVRDGTARLRNVRLAIKQATKATGIVITATTPEADRQAVFSMQERVLRGESP